MGHAMCADVPDHKLVLQPQFFEKVLVLWPGPVMAEVYPVFEDGYFLRINPAGGNFFLKRIGNYDDAICGAVQPFF